MNRYSAKLFFQYRSDLGDGQSNTMRLCEERLIVLSARNAESALRKAKSHGRRAEFEGTAEAGNAVYFEFVGVTDLLKIGIECEPDEVWYHLSTRKLPMERREELVPPEAKLNAIFWERKKRRGDSINWPKRSR